MSELLAFPGGGVSVPVKGRRAVGAGGLVAAIMVLLLVFQVWGGGPGVLLTRHDAGSAIPTRHATNGPSETARRQPSIDPHAAVERATHQVEPVAAIPGRFMVADAAYVSRFDASGFSYTPTGSSTAFGVSLASLHRGSHALPLEIGDWSATDNVAERPAAAGVTERVTARAGAAEWDVVLSSAPAGRGDLVVGARLDGATGQPVRVQTKDGPAWRLGLVGGSSVQLDEMVVKDAHGAVLTRALPTIDGNRAELVVPDAVLAKAAYPLTIDPSVSGPTVVSSTGGYTPSVAYNSRDNQHLVVWKQLVGSNYRIYGARLNGDDGTLLGRVFTISNNLGTDDIHPDVAWNGDSFLVVWNNANSSSILYRRVSATGSLLGAQTVLYTHLGIAVSDPAVAAYDLTGCQAGCAPHPEWLVVWHASYFQGNGFTNEIDGGLVFYDGRISQSGIVISNFDERDEYEPDVSASRNTFIVVWTNRLTDLPNIRMQTVDQTGARGLFPEPDVGYTVSNSHRPQVASDGSNFLVTYSASAAPNTPSDTYGSIFTADNTVTHLDTPISSAAGYQEGATVAYSRGMYLVAWHDERNADYDIYGARVNADAVVQDTDGLRISSAINDEQLPSVSAGPDGKWAVIYEGGNNGDILRANVAPK